MGGKKAKRKDSTPASSPVAISPRGERGERGEVERRVTRGAPNRSAPRFTSMVPVRFEPAMLEEIRRRADDDGRSVSAWIRRAVETELRREDRA